MTSATWTFLSNHGHVMAYLALHPNALLREVAVGVGVTERAAQGIVSDLVDGGFLTRERTGRRNTYTVVPGTTFWHPVERHVRAEDFLSLLRPDARHT